MRSSVRALTLHQMEELFLVVFPFPPSFSFDQRFGQSQHNSK